jgi:hypothetical protein
MRGIVLAVVASLSMAGTRADTVLVSNQHSDAFEVMGQKQDAKDLKQTVWVGAGMMRADTESSSVIVRLDRKKVYLLDHGQKTVNALDLPVDLAKAIAPEAKPMLEQMAAMMKREVVVTPTEETKKIKDWSARRYNVTMKSPMGMSVESVIWATKDVKLDVASFTEMSGVLQTTVPSGVEVAKEMAKIDGVPVLTEATTSIMGTQLKTREELLSAEQKAAPAGTYEVPSEYKEVPFNPFDKMGKQE